MNISVPRERRPDENRVGLTPAAVELLTSDGHRCYVEKGAGLGAGFSDEDYTRAGARTVYSRPAALPRIARRFSLRKTSFTTACPICPACWGARPPTRSTMRRGRMCICLRLTGLRQLTLGAIRWRAALPRTMERSFLLFCRSLSSSAKLM